MNKYLTDEQLDAEIQHFEAVVRTAPADAADYYDIDGIKDRLALLESLQRERAAHHVTREKIKQLRNTLISVNATSMHRPSCPRCARNNRVAFEALRTIYAERDA